MTRTYDMPQGAKDALADCSLMIDYKVSTEGGAE